MGIRGETEASCKVKGAASFSAEILGRRMVGGWERGDSLGALEKARSRLHELRAHWTQGRASSERLGSLAVFQDQGFQCGRCLLVEFWNHMRVRIQGQDDGGVPKALRNHLRVHSSSQEKARMRMPGVVEPYLRQTRLMQQFAPPPADALVKEGGTHAVWKDEILSLVV